MKASKSGWPRVVKSGSVTVRVYKTQSRGYDLYQVADFTSGRRRMRSFSDEAEALAEAGKLARLMATGQTTAAAIRNPDAASYGRAMELLRPTGDPLEIAVGRYAEAVKLLGGCGERLVDAVRFYLDHDPGNLPDKDVAGAVEEFIAHRRARGKSVRYLSDLQSRLGRFSEAFRVKVASVRGPEIQSFLDGLKGSPLTIKNYRTVISTFFAFAKTRGYIRHNPVVDTERLSAASEGAVEIYTPGEMAKLLAAAPSAFVAPLAIGAFAGLRSQEIQRLDWQDVDFESGFITVGGAKAKTRSRRLVPICDTLRAWLLPHVKKSGLLWAGSHDSFYDQQGITSEASGVKWKANGLRHSFASYRLAQTQSANQAALELGNSPGVVFKHYRELVRPDDAARWFGLVPERAANVVPMQNGGRAG